MSVSTTIEERLAVFLAGRPALAALVEDRVHPVKLPQLPEYPSVSFFRVNPVPLTTLDDGPQNVQGTTVQVSAWSTDYYEACRVAETVRQEMQGFRGEMGSMTVGQVIHEGGRDGYDDEAQEPGVHQVSNDYTIWWKTT